MSTKNQRFTIITLFYVLLILAITACARNQSPAPADTITPQAVDVLASIDRVEILIAESFPPQYFLLVESGLPNACVKFDRYTVTREGDTIRVAVINQERADIGCIEVYETVENNIPLGSDLEPGTTYTVLVNDVTETFITQGSEPALDQTLTELNNSFQLEVGQTALIEPQGPIVEFVEVVEDSRCPTDVVCVWAGRARILIRVSSSGDVLGFGIQELTLEAGLVDPTSNSVEGVFDSYLFELVTLDPYPGKTDKGGNTQEEQPNYTATLVVSKSGVDSAQ
ncbi:MAG: hypothetical protein GY832_44335 [Chloroflexi bacterium]|nr:hypothetical protein [Chloroflexota bacterium]